MKTKICIAVIITIIVIIVAKKDLINVEKNNENVETDNYLAFELANQTVQCIKDKDFMELQKYIHDEKGVVFAYATNIDSYSPVFSKKQVGEFGEDYNKYVWGSGTHSDELLELTSVEYFDKYLYKEDYLNVEKISVNNTIGTSNAVDNLEEIFNDCVYVEFYYEGTEKNGYLDWSSLKVVMEEYDGELKVVGLINSYYIM